MNKKELNKKIDGLNKKLDPLRKELRKIDDKKSLKEKQKLLGKCFKYKNTGYDKEIWFTYIKVLSVSNDTYTHLQVERKPDGTLKIILQDEFTYSADYFLHEVEIQEWEFQEQLKTMIRDFSFHVKEDD